MAKFHEVLDFNKKLFPQSRIQVEDNKEMLKCAEEWISYYRSFPGDYCNDVLNFGLKEFQKQILYEMEHNDYFLYDACRG